MHKIIDSNKPLPANTIFKWEECFAKLMLEYVLPTEFYDLAISDRPDLQSVTLNLGIEVTTAVMKEDLELDKLYTDLEYNLVRNKEKVYNKISYLGGNISGGILMHPVRYRDLSHIKKCICNKLKKLNNVGYKRFNRNYLFITDQNLILEQECIDLLKEYKIIQNQYKIKFQKIYIYLYGGKLYEFDIIHNKYNLYDISTNEICEISINARKMVEDKENELI